MNNDVPGVVRCGKPQVKGLVRFFQQQGVTIGIRTHAVMHELELPPRVIDSRVDEGLRIRGPCKPIARVADTLINDVAARRILNDPRPALVAFGILRPGDQTPIRGRHQFPDLEELFTLGAEVFVEKKLLAFQCFAICQHRSVRVARGRHAVVLRIGVFVILALEIPPVPNALGSRIHNRRGERIKLRNEVLSQLLRRLADLFRPLIFRMDMGNDIRVVTLTQPIPRIIKIVPVNGTNARPKTLRGNRSGLFSHVHTLREHTGIWSALELSLPKRSTK